jgi:hypothetical protein
MRDAEYGREFGGRTADQIFLEPSGTTTPPPLQLLVISPERIKKNDIKQLSDYSDNNYTINVLF